MRTEQNRIRSWDSLPIISCSAKEEWCVTRERLNKFEQHHLPSTRCRSERKVILFKFVQPFSSYTSFFKSRIINNRQTVPNLVRLMLIITESPTAKNASLAFFLVGKRCCGVDHVWNYSKFHQKRPKDVFWEIRPWVFLSCGRISFNCIAFSLLSSVTYQNDRNETALIHPGNRFLNFRKMWHFEIAYNWHERKRSTPADSKPLTTRLQQHPTRHQHCTEKIFGNPSKK